MLSARSSLISMNWPELTLSTSLRGNGWAADDRVRPAVAAGWGSRVLAGKVLVRVLVPDCCWEVVIGAPVWVAAVSDTEVRRCGGGRGSIEIIAKNHTQPKFVLFSNTNMFNTLYLWLSSIISCELTRRKTRKTFVLLWIRCVGY